MLHFRFFTYPDIFLWMVDIYIVEYQIVYFLQVYEFCFFL